MSNLRYKYGCKKDPIDERDFKFSAVVRPQICPPLVDLSKTTYIPKIFDQSTLGSCHDDITEVLTNTGWKLFNDITYNDMLASVNPKTKELIYENPTGITKYMYHGNMICLNNTYTNFKVTPNHKMLVNKWNNTYGKFNNNFELVEAEKLPWYSQLLSKIHYNGDNSKNITINGVDHKRILYRNSIEYDTVNWLRLLGLYIAEGTMCKDEGHYKIQIAAVKEREKTFAKSVFNSLNIHYLELKDRFTFDDKRIYETYKSYGLYNIKAQQKFVPDFIFKYSSELIREFLFGYFNGDGCKENDTISYYTSSIKLANDVQRLCFLSGEQSGIYIRNTRHSIMSDGRIVKGNYPEHRISAHHLKNVSLEKKKTYTEYYDGYVYCAEVPTYHTLVTRRNNKILISGNCTANAIGNCYLFVRNKQGQIDPDYIPSRLFIYFNEREVEGTINEDSGACIRTGIKVLNKYGACHEKYCPYLIESFTDKPTKEAYDDGLNFQALVYKRITNSILDMKSCLAEGYPFVLGIQIFENFESEIVSRTGLVGLPSGSCLGGHAVLVVGYDDSKKLFKVMNSWGDTWGDHGYFYLPYDYLTNNELAMDLWTLRKVE